MKEIRLCKCGCGKSIQNKHKNARFLNQKHKDKYWNKVNPRGKFAFLGMERSLNDETADSFDSLEVFESFES